MSKHFFLILLFSISLITHSKSQVYQWIDLTANLPDTSLFGGFGKVVFIGEHGWITQQWYTLPREIYYTSDGGETFVTQPLPDDAGTVGDIFIRSNYEGYVVTYWDEQGNTGKIFHSDDARSGDWSLLAEVSGSGFFSVTFPPLPATTGYLGSAAGEVWKINGGDVTYDGWCNTLYDVLDLSFPLNPDTGWAATAGIEHREVSGWQIGGQNYSAQGLSAICFLDNHIGWVCGDDQEILHTTDGHNWVNQHSGSTFSLHDIRMCNLINGWAVGNGLIFHTSDGGTHWMDESAQLNLVDVELTGVSVVDAQTAYAVGMRRSTLTPVFLKYTSITGIHELPELQFKIFPNPACREIEISLMPGQFLANMLSVELTDLCGNVLMITRDSGAGKRRISFDLSPLSPGIYFVVITVDNQKVVKKIIRN